MTWLSKVIFMGLPFNGLLRNLQFKLTGNPTHFPTHCQNRRLSPGGYSPTFVARGPVRNILGAGAVGGLSFLSTKV